MDRKCVSNLYSRNRTRAESLTTLSAKAGTEIKSSPTVSLYGLKISNPLAPMFDTNSDTNSQILMTIRVVFSKLKTNTLLMSFLKLILLFFSFTITTISEPSVFNNLPFTD